MTFTGGDGVADEAQDRLYLLRAARDRLVTAMNGDLTCRSCSRGLDPPLPGLIRELRAVLTEIDQVPGSGEVTSLDLIAGAVTDQLAARRTTKRSAG